MTQKIRPSQFITTYGPGSIIELPDGPVLIPLGDEGLFLENNQYGLKVSDYAINDQRMSKGVLKEAKIFRLPTNSELGLENDATIYRTKKFPEWNLCLNSDYHPTRTDILYNFKERGQSACPICRVIPDTSRLLKGSAIRFVSVCKNGHLDDVPWYDLIHHGTTCSETNSVINELKNKNSLLWKTSAGTGLRYTEIECPRCGKSENLGSLYSREINCTARFPETEGLKEPPSRKFDCSVKAKIMQRQAANIRIPEIKTLLSVQSVMMDLNSQLQNPSIVAAIKITLKSIDPEWKVHKTKITTQDQLDDFFDNMETLDVAPKIIKKFKDESLETLVQLMDDFNKPIPVGYHDLILDEFNELRKASIYGAPPSAHQSKSKILFEAEKGKNFVIGKNTFVVTPISKLQTISVQTGFKRDDTGDDLLQSDSELVKTSFFDDAGTEWYPGVSYTGEGIFIRLDGDNVLSDILNGDDVKQWLKTHHEETTSGEVDYTRYLFRDSENSRDELHPGFVWWHTLSHLLIRIISEESGYSSSSIRERIYFKYEGGKINGGILLYAAQPGAEGTLGGLIALLSHFESFLNTAFEKSAMCSADPLCTEDIFKHKDINGACCFGCLMNSETSCEHRNMWLDRNVLKKSLP